MHKTVLLSRRALSNIHKERIASADGIFMQISDTNRHHVAIVTEAPFIFLSHPDSFSGFNAVKNLSSFLWDAFLSPCNLLYRILQVGYIW
jgi:hypothetical protein